MQTYKNYQSLETKAVELFNINQELETLENTLESSKMSRKTILRMVEKYTNEENDIAKLKHWCELKDGNEERFSENLAVHNELLKNKLQLEVEVNRLKFM